jgi:flagellar export protein FliJ
MQEIQRKMKRIKPVVEIRRREMEHEASSLVQLQMKKNELVKTLRMHQKMYLDGIQDLNLARSNNDGARVQLLESSVDFARDRWTKSFKEVQQLEKIEKSQIEQLSIAQRELKIAEILEEKYHQEFKSEIGRKEQADMDEVAIQSHFRNKAS